MEQPVIRTLTLGIPGPHPLALDAIRQAAGRLAEIRAFYEDEGYQVQTVRITSRPVFSDLTEPNDLMNYAVRLQSQLDDLAIGHFSLGPAPAVGPRFPLRALEVIGDLLPTCPALSSAALLATAADGARTTAARQTARVICRIAAKTEAGSGNFRFAALACVGPGHPFFPASYHEGPGALSIGLQSAGVVARALADGRLLDPATLTKRVRAAVAGAAAPVVELGRQVSAWFGLAFGGIDLSPAPWLQASIGAAIGECLPGGFGAPGTIAMVAAITAALRTTRLPTCGYNGVMLPVLEDPVLAQAWERGQLTPHELLAYSSVCGTGLDSVPLPGDVTEEEITGLLLDMAALAYRLRKPLSARLFPLPGVLPGQRTAFTDPYLINLRLPPGRVSSSYR